MNVEGVLQLFREGLDLGALLQQLAPQAVYLMLQDVDVGHTVLQDVQLTPRLPKLQLQQSQFVQPAQKQNHSSINLNTSKTTAESTCTEARPQLSQPEHNQDHSSVNLHRSKTKADST